ncbi:MAG TPA: efflux RND transporter permease subunit [Burkholderiales bacterium]|nr:efflux RND transporter permease subunit [Burkholderiales bacterium]
MIAAIVRLSIRYAGVVVALAATLIVYGLYTLVHANLDVFPEFSPSQVVIQTEAPGLSAEMVETLVTQPIENSLAGASGLTSLRSQSIPGLSVITVVFEDGSDIHRNRQMVGERLAALAGQMPRGVEAPAMTPLTSSASTVLGMGVTSARRSLMELRTLTDWTIRPHLLAVPGVAEVNVFGGEVRQWQIQVEPERLRRYGLSINEVVDAARNATAAAGTGAVRTANQHIIIEAKTQPAGPEEVGRAVLAWRDGQAVRIADVARVTEGAAPSIGAAAIDGTPGVFMMVQGQLGANTHAVTRALERAIEELKPLLDKEQVMLHAELFRPANFIETAIRNLRRDIAIGSALVVLVLFLFLFNKRTAFICTLAIPVSLLAAVLVLDHFGVALNVMVLGGLAIALGEVVDDAIIDTENIFRRLRLNRAAAHPRPVERVVLDASVEVRSSVVYATFIVALVFVPLLTLSGVAGKLFAPLGLAYIFAILASLVVAVTLTPALCYLLLGRGELAVHDPPSVAWLKPRYLALLRRIERYPARVISAVFAVIAAGIALLPLFSGEFIPALREGHYIIHMTAVPGTSEAESLRIGGRVSQAILSIDGVKSVAQWVGRSKMGADTFGTHYSEFEVEIGALPGKEQARILREIRARLSGESGAAFPGVAFAVNTFLTERIEETITGYAAPLVVSLYGSDLDALDRDALAVAAALASVPGARDVQLQAPPGTPQVAVRLRHEAAAALGLTPAAVLQAMHAAFEGARVGQVHQGTQTIDLVVVLPPERRDSMTELGALVLRNPEGRLVRLVEVADIAVTGGRAKVLHSGGRRLQTVTANLEGRDLQAFERDARRAIAQSVRLSPGNYMVVSGTAEAQRQARADLVVHSLLAAVGVFLLLYIAFNNLPNLLVTFANLPFALIGGVVAVLASGGWLSLGSLVGFVTLFGITLRNAIMLVSHYQHLVQAEGETWGMETALRGAAERLPSILMTALVTGLGLLPLALGSGEPGREIEGPMATIIVGGLATSTLLNLLVLPTMLLHFGRFERVGNARSGGPS